ncbi:hypothetical protein [Microbispora sp. CA-102843]|uniref:hypothetical protein n=1 Tax=Microbispora sp. CA-102843 TaxID=3239952 RepID=UPI003D8A91A0
MSEPDKDLLRKALARAVAGLTGAGRLTVVEVAVDGVTTFTVHRDENGTPRGRRRSATWTDLLMEHGEDEPGAAQAARQAVLRAAGLPSPDGEFVFVRSTSESAEAEAALEWLCAERPAPVHPADAPLTALVEEVLAGTPLSRSYDLVVLRADRATGRLELAGKQLFPVGTQPGTRANVALRCEPGDEHGTVFAVVTRQGREPRLLSMHSGRLTPGPYEVTVELVRPGKVRFVGLPELVLDWRDWGEMVASVPSRLPARTGPSHLICAVEVCGPPEKVTERLSRARQVVTFLSDELADLLRVSLVAYGAHSFGRAKEHPVVTACWRAPAARALAELDRLEERGAVTQGYPYHPHAAQLEDMLAEVAARLDRTAPAPTVLLTVGERQPHPATADPSGLLPCPHRHDWKRLLEHLEHRCGVAFGAICDRPPGQANRVWRRLGAKALGHLDALDAQELAADLGLAAPATGRLPFPLIDETE